MFPAQAVPHAQEMEKEAERETQTLLTRLTVRHRNHNKSTIINRFGLLKFVGGGLQAATTAFCVALRVLFPCVE